MTFNIANQITGPEKRKISAAGALAVPRLGERERHHLLEASGVGFPVGVALLSSNSTTLHLMPFPSLSSRFIFALIASSAPPHPPPPHSPPVNPAALLVPTARLSCCRDEILQRLALGTAGRLRVGPSGSSFSVTDSAADSTPLATNASKQSRGAPSPPRRTESERTRVQEQVANLNPHLVHVRALFWRIAFLNASHRQSRSYGC